MFQALLQRICMQVSGASFSQVPEEYKRKALCGQGGYRANPIQEPIPGHTVDSQSEEQHEEFPDERSGQNPAEKTCFD